MAQLVFTNGYVLLNAVDLSAAGTDVTLPLDADIKDNTTFGSSGWKSNLPGLKSAKIDVMFNQDFAAANVDATLFPALGTAIAFEFRPTSAARSATNPAYTGSAIVANYSPFGSGVGDVAKAKLTLVVTGAVARQTA